LAHSEYYTQNANRPKRTWPGSHHILFEILGPLYISGMAEATKI